MWLISKPLAQCYVYAHQEYPTYLRLLDTQNEATFGEILGDLTTDILILDIRQDPLRGGLD